MPSNAGYYVAAYVATALILSVYALTLVLRTRAVRARLQAAAGDQQPE